VLLSHEVSNLVGTNVGTRVGLCVSFIDGAGVLLNDGFWVEDPVRSAVGRRVGQIIGLKVGVVVVLNVGCSDGFLVGL